MGLDLGRKCFFFGRELWDGVFEGVAVRVWRGNVLSLMVACSGGLFSLFYFMLCKCVRGTRQAVWWF